MRYLDYKICKIWLLKIITGQLFLTFQVVSNNTNSYSCDINSKNDMTPQTPLLLYANENRFGKIEFIHPSEDNTIHIERGFEIILACPGSYFKSNPDLSIQTVQCLGDNLFADSEEKHNLSYYDCEKAPQTTLRKLGISYLGDSIMHYKIGFEIDNEIFLELIDFYFDIKSLLPLYTVHQITKDLNEDQRSKNIPYKGMPEHYQKISTNKIYDTKYQKKIFHIYITPQSAERYINGDHFLAKSNLVPMEDFLYYPQQEGTYYDVLTAPQFKKFKDGNWKILEEAIRRLAIDRYINLTVYTGVYGELNITGSPVHMDRHSLGYNVIPVPKIFWKIVKHKNQAIVFIGYNDPFPSRFSNPARQICSPGLCDDLSWVMFDKNPHKGVINCCSYQDFQKKIYVPHVKKIKDVLF
ncbi:uncharacterized protein LOC126907634 [Daktulosphaira vitifoliae]|uniref:uncharacterized protein LOC126907634 n=1 Tax=Daktulosphaira vitifoliae TaxID=58002 RepID=UPI0021A9922A|nr:uncharacterized protein LOC126907634 [Daktulosphaira vitifoliae]XP_050545016.1 uncharacterized protein LOC126907634 [Daktulosphaira vitifoliae]